MTSIKRENIPEGRAEWRKKLFVLVFESETRGGRVFDIVLIASILLSVACVIVESLPTLSLQYRQDLHIVENVFSILFTIEFILRLVSVPKPRSYFFSFFGLVDFFSALPVIFIFTTTAYQGFIIIRAFRLLRIFRVFKLAEYTGEADVLMKALKASRHKITVFIGTVLSVIVILGSMMYLIEGPQHGFTSIPTSMYWSIVTLTTVGYGDITPATTLGKMMASLIMLLGYGVIAVPTGIVSAEIGRASRRASLQKPCPRCGEDKYLPESRYCFRCGERI